jgi:hypothetical protein
LCASRNRFLERLHRLQRSQSKHSFIIISTADAAADEVDKRNPKPPSAARAVYHGRSEVRAALTVATGGFADKSMTLEEKATKATGACRSSYT